MRILRFLCLLILFTAPVVRAERQDMDCTIQPLQGETWLRVAVFGRREPINIDCRRMNPDPRETLSEAQWTRKPEREEEPPARNEPKERKCTCRVCDCR